jgi:agmatine deiminase
MQIWFPPEWHRQSGVLIAWPHSNTDWRNLLDMVEPVYAQIAFHISARERLLIVCADDNHINRVRKQLIGNGSNLDNIRFYAVPTNDTWTRDFGPLCVYQNGHAVLVNCRFNGWGGKYPSELDNAVTEHLFKAGAFTSDEKCDLPLVLEGGSIETDGQGTVLTTSHCLLTPTRNAKMDRSKFADMFAQYFGIKRVLWLDHGELKGDDTDGHIDTLARFCDEHTIAYVACRDTRDAHYESLHALEQQLRRFRTAQGEPYALKALPLPKPIHNHLGERLPATYANFLIINDAVLTPIYNVDSDQKALDTLQSCFPDREIIGIDCVPLIQQFGSLHCITMQLPLGAVR